MASAVMVVGRLSNIVVLSVAVAGDKSEELTGTIEWWPAKEAIHSPR
jgi:hypothetical protein